MEAVAAGWEAADLAAESVAPMEVETGVVVAAPCPVGRAVAVDSAAARVVVAAQGAAAVPRVAESAYRLGC